MGKRKLTTRQRNDILKLRDKGLSYDKIAKLYNINIRSVYEIVLRSKKKDVDK